MSLAVLDSDPKRAMDPHTRRITVPMGQILPGRMDNHLLDVLVGCCVAASVQGLVWSPGGSAAFTRQPAQPMKKHSELQREKLAGRNLA